MDDLTIWPSNEPSFIELDDYQSGHLTGLEWRAPKTHYRDLRTRFSALLKDGLDASDIDYRTRRAIRQAAGLVPHSRPHGSPMSHRGMRKTAARLLYRDLRIPFAQGGRKWFFGTFITDLGNSLKYRPVIEIGRLKRDVSKMLRLIDMHAIGVVEIQRARYGRGSAGQTIQAHTYTIGYTYDPSFDADIAHRSIAERATLTNWLGAPVAVSRPITDLDDLNRRCQYVFKPPLHESYTRSNA